MRTRSILVLLLFCFIAPLALLFACTQNGDVEEITKSTEEVKPQSSKEKAYEEERVRIAKYSDHVRRVGETLYLKLNFVSEITFKNLTECNRYETCWHGFFEEYLPDIDLYILRGELYEGIEYEIVSGKSGKSYRMYAYPEVSPNRLHMVAVSSDDLGGGENSIRLWRIEQSELIEEFYYNAEDSGYYNHHNFSEWHDNNTVIIKRFSINSSITPCPKSDAFEAQFALRHKGDSWELDKEPIEGTLNCSPGN